MQTFSTFGFPGVYDFWRQVLCRRYHGCRQITGSYADRAASLQQRRLRCDPGNYSGIASPDPPISLGKSFNFGRPSFIGRTVSS